MLAKRYNGRSSLLSNPIKPIQSATLKRLSYFSSKKAILEPIPPKETHKEEEVDPVDEIESSSMLTNVPIRKNSKHSNLDLPELPSLVKDYSEELLNQKIELCCNMCDFTDPDADLKAKSIKARTLQELDNFLSIPGNLPKLTTKTIEKLQAMLDANLFSGPAPVNPTYLSFDEEPPIMNVNWPHNSLVLKLIQRIQSEDPKHPLLKKNLHKLITIFHSCDQNERELAYSIVNAILESFQALETPTLQYLSQLLLAYTAHEINSFAVTPILKIYNARLPSSKYGTEIFIRACIPLIRTPRFKNFAPQFQTLAKAFAQKDPNIAVDMIEKMIQWFPIQQASKQVVAIETMIQICETLNHAGFVQIVPSFFQLLCEYSQSEHSRVAEAALQVWTNIQLYPLMVENSRLIFPIVFDDFTKAMNTHWSQSTRNALNNAIRSMREMDPGLFDELTNKQRRAEKKKPAESPNTKLKTWVSISRAATMRDRTINLAQTLANVHQTFTKPFEDQMIPKPRQQVVSVTKSHSMGSQIVIPSIRNYGRNSV